MLDRSLCSVAMVAILVLGSGGAASGQTLPPPPQNKNLGRYPPTPPPDFALKVDYDKKRVPQGSEGEYQRVQNVLNRARIGTQDDRTRYFQSIIKPDSIRVQGWNGIIDSIAAAEAGIVVRVRVYANQPGMVDSAHLIERYSIINDEVKYLGSVIPPPHPRIQIGY